GSSSSLDAKITHPHLLQHGTGRRNQLIAQSSGRKRIGKQWIVDRQNEPGVRFKCANGIRGPLTNEAIGRAGGTP
ncbi:MAG: hypothetical protein WCL11_22800, partial [Verrucomicrobiota bacterium]